MLSRCKITKNISKRGVAQENISKNLQKSFKNDRRKAGNGLFSEDFCLSIILKIKAVAHGQHEGAVVALFEEITQ